MMMATHRGASYHRQNRKAASRYFHCQSPSLQSIPEDDWISVEDSLHHHQHHPNHSHCVSPPTPTTTVRKIGDCGMLQLRNDHPMNSLEASTRSELVDMIEYERSVRRLHPFQVTDALNQLATQQARAMAKLGIVFHTVATIGELQLFLSSDQVAENIQRGDTASQMHDETMGRCRQDGNASVSHINRSNLLSPYFTEFGCGVAVGRDGKIYCCQLFRN